MKPAARREWVGRVRQSYQLSEKRACGLIGITRWINRYQSRRDPETELRMRTREMAGSRVRYGYRRLAVLLRREGWVVNTKKVYRSYREEGLQVRTKIRGKRTAHARVPLSQAGRPNQRWNMDFVSDRLKDGRWFRILTVVDQYTRECLCINADRSQTGEKVIEPMERLAAMRGVRNRSPPTTAANSLVGNGRLGASSGSEIGLYPAWPAPPERLYRGFNGRLRDECLNSEVFRPG